MTRSSKGQFRLGVVTIEVFTNSGECHVEDWAPQDAGEARDYASETACCSDVTKVEFRNGSEHRVYVNPRAPAAH